MSYDLYFTSPKISADQFYSYFHQRPRYKVSNNQAWYSNEDTGVYFNFEYNDQPKEEDFVDYSALFTINLFRPHFFILEAEPEVTQLIANFQFSTHDPQSTGMEEGAYSPDGLITGWLHSNEFGYRAILGTENAPATIYTRPAIELENVWKWNFQNEVHSQGIQKDIFIPHILYVLVDGYLCSACAWPDAISTLIPRVDRLIIPRKELAPKKLFQKSQEDMCIIPFAEALPILEPYKTDHYELTSFELPSPNCPPSIKNFVRKLSPHKATLERISIDNILNRELVEKYMA